MSIICDTEIIGRANQGMITPFAGKRGSHPQGGLSYGVGPYGYDVRLGSKFKIFRTPTGQWIDPLNFDPGIVREAEASDYIDIPPHGFVLGVTVEHFKIPRDIIVTCVGKSTIARCGVIVHVTPVEPEFRGHITLELSNTTDFPVRVYVGYGIAQFLFHRADRMCARSYNDIASQYMDQGPEPVLPRAA